MTNNNLKISFLISLSLSLISLNVFSQIFDSEQNPLSVKWRTIYTHGFKLIYPTELEKEAQRMANTLVSIYPTVGLSLGRQKTTLPIVLQNRGTVANGFVQLAPKKSQFYTTPPQQFDSQDWLNNLAVHELRHVAQFDKITGTEKFFLTEEISFAYLGAAVPIWFFEGDAVSTETSLTNAGRGRQPSWIMPFRTSLLSGKKFSYSKSYFGSEKDQTPGYYQLGYLIASNMRSSFGKNIMDSLLEDINERPIRFYPFSNSLKKLTGLGSAAYYKKTITQIKADWEQQDRAIKSEHYESLNRTAKYASNYYLPTAISSDQILALKQTKGDVAGFVLVNADKSETSLFKIGYQEQVWYSYGNGKLVWDEIRYDPRYKQRSYSVICSYDFATKKRKQLTFRTRLFSPAISGDGKKLVAVQIDLSNNCTLVTIDLADGKVSEGFSNPAKLILQTPALNATGEKIAFIGVTEKGKSLWLLNNDNKVEKIIPETNQQLTRPIFIVDNIAFNAHLSGVDNIYLVSPSSKKITALTAAKFGAFNAGITADGKSILFNNYQLMGYDIAKTPIVPKPIPANTFAYFGAAAEKQENTGNVFDKVLDSTYKSATYRPLAHLFKFHSLSFTLDEDDQIGFGFKSNDLLNLLDFYAGVGYDDKLRKLTYNANLAFKAFYPVISANFKNRARSAFYQLGGTISQADWRENYIELKASVPVSYSVYNHNYSWRAQVGTSYTERNFASKEKLLFKNTVEFPMSYQIGFVHSVRAAERDVAPGWLQSFNLSYFNQPFDKALDGSLFAFESSLYFPGLMKNHSFEASFNYQESTGSLTYGNEINTVYGYNQIVAKSLLRNTLLLNYRFPIAFTDAEIGSLAYIRNIRGGFFSHYENIGSETTLTQPKTFGIELRSSVNLLRYQPVIDFGTRIIFTNQIYHQNPILEFTLNLNY
jgi:hypothetical protein